MRCETIKINSIEDLKNEDLLGKIRNVLDNEDIVCVEGVLSKPQCDGLIKLSQHHKKEENTIIWKQTGLPQWNSLKVGEMPEYSPPACAGSYTSFSFDRDDIFPDLQFYKNFYLSLSGIETDFSTPSSYDFNLRLNFIRYSVGDYFGKHRHGYDNQKYGMILNLSSYDEDIEDLRSGTTVWNSKGEEINTKHTQDVGDLILFNYGCVHEVDKVIKGTRWNVILPNLRK